MVEHEPCADFLHNKRTQEIYLLFLLEWYNYYSSVLDSRVPLKWDEESPGTTKHLLDAWRTVAGNSRPPRGEGCEQRRLS